MSVFQTLVSGIITIITGTLGNSSFTSTLLFAPFLIWVFRQIFSFFHMLISESYKKW